MAHFNIKEIFKRAFGYEAPTQKPVIPSALARTENSLLGQPFYGSDNLGREFFLPVWLDGYFIPFAVMSMNWKKTYVSTSMPERGGSVHELINIDDYVFNIKGIFVNELNDFPEQEIIDLHNIFKKNKSITLKCALSAIVLSGEFDEKVIIRDVKFPDMQGIEHAKAFEISVESDMIFDLIID
ncbi:hypothetical protein SAMN05428988_1309 [Chitinophaga sp. YR573]|uniref:DUF6046 domain-containing protein n=1 Tax=Chitinophaga sp. YR573 TaxID=1881040 RepID=UPI0008C62D2F|nr:DUF6046 domain-containing protein [Chitinophaga sp. YR573]SEW01888.1 hypothetical protein SAMN05428988_1309 [Chitinophaga sp. YR573]